MYASEKELSDSIKEVCKITEKGVNIIDENRLRTETIDSLVYNSVFNQDHNVQDTCTWIIWESSQALGIIPSSIHGLYEARGRSECSGFTVPAINLRGLTYDTARAVLRAGMKNNVGAVIFEIARSEIIYTEQRPREYATVILAAAVKEGFRGPVFIQGDHFQFSVKKFRENPEKETNAIKDITGEAIEAGFYNIDIDSSTLVELEKTGILEQQRNNYTAAANITGFIRQKEPKGVTVSVGGEIGEVGGKNSTPEELRGFMDGYLGTLKGLNPGFKRLSKISVQTGTSHGGVVLPDGSIAEVKLDFNTLETLSKIARDEYGMSGAVQHGASTLPAEAFHRFPETETAEVHLATEFQNMIYEHPAFPSELQREIYDYLHKECADEKKPDQTEEQFIYKTRKKALGPFKKKMWDMPGDVRCKISGDLENKFTFLFKKLNVINTKGVVDKYIKLVKVPKPRPTITKRDAGTPLEAGYHIDEIGE